MRGDYGSGKFNNYCNNQICKIHEAVRDNGTYTSPTGRVYSNTSEPVTLQVGPNLKKSSIIQKNFIKPIFEFYYLKNKRFFFQIDVFRHYV